MPAELTIIAAFLMGLLGSVHCIGMCGGIAGAFSTSLPAPVRRSWLRMLPLVLSYNGGRIASYAAAGAVAGLVGAEASRLLPPPVAQAAGALISGVFLIALGLYLSGWWRALAALERFGAKLWRHIEPLGRRVLPITGAPRAFGFGLVWGWLPCGLVYSALAWSLTAGSAPKGALLMAAFGLGTLPMLLTLGATGGWLANLARRATTRQAAGTLMILFGIYAVANFDAHHHIGAHSDQAQSSTTDSAAHANH